MTLQKRKRITKDEQKLVLDKVKNIEKNNLLFFISEISKEFNCYNNVVRRFLITEKIISAREPLRSWTDEENKILKKFAGSIPLDSIVKRIAYYHYRLKQAPRTKFAVHAQIRKLGLSVDVTGEYFNCFEISELLGCSEDKVKRWFRNKEISKILQPVANGNRLLVSRKNLANFFVEYRSELVGCNLDVEWLLSLFI